MSELNTAPLTREFLAAATKRVVFEPRSPDEAEYIAQQLRGLGFRYFNESHEKNLNDALKGSMYLDTDKTIMVSGSKIDGLLANADQLVMGMPFAGNLPMTIDIKHGSYAFFPRTAGEGRAAFLALAKEGVKLPEDVEGGSFALGARAIYQGLLVKDGVASLAPRSEDLQDAKILTSADLGLGPTITMTPEQSALYAAFNEIAVRLGQMGERLKRVEDEVIPKPLDKAKTTGLKIP